jgi:hypothetical protein
MIRDVSLIAPDCRGVRLADRSCGVATVILRGNTSLLDMPE